MAIDPDDLEGADLNLEPIIRELARLLDRAPDYEPLIPVHSGRARTLIEIEEAAGYDKPTRLSYWLREAAGPNPRTGRPYTLRAAQRWETSAAERRHPSPAVMARLRRAATGAVSRENNRRRARNRRVAAESYRAFAAAIAQARARGLRMRIHFAWYVISSPKREKGAWKPAVGLEPISAAACRPVLDDWVAGNQAEAALELLNAFWDSYGFEIVDGDLDDAQIEIA